MPTPAKSRPDGSVKPGDKPNVLKPHEKAEAPPELKPEREPELEPDLGPQPERRTNPEPVGAKPEGPRDGRGPVVTESRNGGEQATGTPAEPQDAPADGPFAGIEFPVPVYNPFIAAERFRVEAKGGWVRFVGGKYVAATEDELGAALNALAYHKRGGFDPQVFVGDDLKHEYACRESNCGFRTRNEEAREAHIRVGHA